MFIESTISIGNLHLSVHYVALIDSISTNFDLGEQTEIYLLAFPHKII